MLRSWGKGHRLGEALNFISSLVLVILVASDLKYNIKYTKIDDFSKSSSNHYLKLNYLFLFSEYLNTWIQSLNQYMGLTNQSPNIDIMMYVRSHCRHLYEVATRKSRYDALSDKWFNFVLNISTYLMRYINAFLFRSLWVHKVVPFSH